MLTLKYSKVENLVKKYCGLQFAYDLLIMSVFNEMRNLMDSIFGTKSDDLLYSVKKAISDKSIFYDLDLQDKLEDAFLNMGLMDYVLNETTIIALTNRAGQILYVNDRFCKISGYEKNEIIGKTHRLVNSNLHPKSYFEDMWSVILKGEMWTGEICNKRKNGELYWVKTYIIPLELNKKNLTF